MLGINLLVVAHRRSQGLPVATDQCVLDLDQSPGECDSPRANRHKGQRRCRGPAKEVV